MLRDGLGPDTLLWRHLGDRRFLLTLPRAVSLQVLHPAIARGLREHSRTPQHIWLHERHTVPLAIRIAYENRDLSSVIRRGHEHVKGVLDDGSRYHALNPDVFFFQHATLVDTLVTMIGTFVRPLSELEHEQLYRECCAWYRRYGVSDRAMPESWAAFRRYFETACRQKLWLNPDAEYYRDQLLHPDAWVVRRVPRRAVAQLMHPRARELFGVRAGGSGALDRYALRRRAVAVLRPNRRLIPVARKAFAGEWAANLDDGAMVSPER